MVDQRFEIGLYSPGTDTVLDQTLPYHNLLNWAWEDLDGIEDDLAKPIADGRVDREIASFGATVRFGLDGAMVFPDRDSMVAFLLKWG